MNKYADKFPTTPIIAPHLEIQGAQPQEQATHHLDSQGTPNQPLKEMAKISRLQPPPSSPSQSKVEPPWHRCKACEGLNDL